MSGPRLPQPPPERAQATPTMIGPLSLWRVWHPTGPTPAATALRSFGPLFRFDPHPSGLPREHGPRGPLAWYGALLFDTSLYERFARGAEVVDICPQMRATLVAVADRAAVLDLTDPAQCRTLAASPRLGDTVLSSYALTQEWARYLYPTPGVHGLRYWSARHRLRGRYGVNTVFWRKKALGRARHQHRLIDDAVWPHVVVALDHAGVAVNRVSSCAAC